MRKLEPNRPEEVSQRHAGSSGAAWQITGGYRTLTVWKHGKTATQPEQK